MIAEPASYAFTTAAQREWLTPRGFSLLQSAIVDGHGLGEDLAHEVARALRGWAASRGATQVAFRVHALAGEPAEYRLELPRLTGQDLVGGAHATPARGRLTWDPASAAFIRVDGRGATLCLPSVLASADGEALDHRLPLMRSEDALAAVAARALRLLGGGARERVLPTVALSRAFELVDAQPGEPRGVAERVSGCMIEAERALDRVAAGVRIGGQVLTVLPAATGLAADRLTLALEVLADVAPRYGLTLRAGAAGPDAWSLMAGAHGNLLAPGSTPRAHLRFAFFAAAVVRAFAAHPGLVGRLDLGPDLDAVLAALARGELFAGSDEERGCGAPPLPRVAGRATAYGFSGAGFALGALDPFTSTVVNTIVADAIIEQVRSVQAWLTAGEDFEPAVREVIADAYRRHRHAGRTLVPDTATRVFAEHSVMSARELEARRAARLRDEAREAVERARAYVAPAAILRRARLSPPRTREASRQAAEIDEALRTVQAASRALDAIVAAGDTSAVPPLLADLRAAAQRLTPARTES
ncbi:glutamine synthetase III [Solirubrobacter deserti]|uniref:Glutamine synthetase III n=1 Tax=Solirubrobacter deserti TaxID=2282478 RepID=A0ABT4RS78_9ACTN|nr:glutamine synthetase III [Solirubrobacter deserti]MDA0141453.1 glutamine synthetase III [Solirubrobacter deserti]